MTEERDPRPRRGRRRVWPWFAAALLAAVLLRELADDLGWPGWVGGILFALGIGVASGIGSRLWRRRMEDSSR